jgi:hypothetical protein
MTLPSARQMSGRAKKAHPGLGACQSEKLELEISPVALRQRLDHRMVRLLSTRVEKKVTTSPDGRLSRSSLEQQSHRPHSSSASLFTAAALAFFILSQSGERP